MQRIGAAVAKLPTSHPDSRAWRQAWLGKWLLRRPTSVVGIPDTLCDLFVTLLSISLSNGLFLESWMSVSGHPFTPPSPVAIFFKADWTVWRDVINLTSVFTRIFLLLLLIICHERRAFKTHFTRTGLKSAWICDENAESWCECHGQVVTSSIKTADRIAPLIWLSSILLQYIRPFHPRQRISKLKCSLFRRVCQHSLWYRWTKELKTAQEMITCHMLCSCHRKHVQPYTWPQCNAIRSVKHLFYHLPRLHGIFFYVKLWNTFKSYKKLKWTNM